MHLPVLLKETIEILNPKEDQVFIDCTLGEGGHSKAILERLKDKGKLLGIDIDPEAIKSSQKNLARFKDRIIFNQGNFKNLKKIAERHHFKKIGGILFDLGVSSSQLEDEKRGFSFKSDGLLDMRMGAKKPGVGKGTASWFLNHLSEKELERIFREYGEERFSHRIAHRIIQERRKKPILRTLQLVEIIRKAIPPKFHHRRIHPATRVFQALRIAVNSELENLNLALPQAIPLLAKGGKLVVISFHSKEDRIVKNFLKKEKEQGKIEILTKKPIRPTQEEIFKNRRSRSAKLRAGLKL